MQTYTDLTTALGNWLQRSDITALFPNFIQLFEACANRRLRVRQQEATAILVPNTVVAVTGAANNGSGQVRLALAGTTFAVITYVMVVLEPKDRVLYRWMGTELAQGHLARIAWAMQGWMMSCKGAFIIGIALIAWLAHEDAMPAAAFVGSALGFLLRDVSIFILLQTLPGRRRGDFAALVTLFTLYVLMPWIADDLGMKQALVLFYPRVSTPLWMSPAVAWAEALVVATLAVSRIATGAKQALATAPA